MKPIVWSRKKPIHHTIAKSFVTTEVQQLCFVVQCNVYYKTSLIKTRFYKRTTFPVRRSLARIEVSLKLQ